MAKTKTKTGAKAASGAGKTVGGEKSASRHTAPAGKMSGGGKTVNIAPRHAAKAVRPAAKQASASKNSMSSASTRAGLSKTKTAENMTTKTTLKASGAARAGQRPKTAAPGKAASTANAAARAKASVKAAVKPATAAIKIVAKPAIKPVAKPAVKPAAKLVAKPAAKHVAKPAAEPIAKSPAKNEAVKPAAVKVSPGKPGVKLAEEAKKATPAPVAVQRSPGGTRVSAKSAAERLVAVRAAVAAKTQVGRAPAGPLVGLVSAGVGQVPLAKPYVPGASRPGSSFSSGRPGFPPGGGPNVKPMPKPSGGKHFGFKALEYIVYPAHGVGQIVAIEEQQVAGYTLELFVVNFAKDKLTLKVPAPKVAHGAIRKLADEALVQRSLDCLTGRARIKRTMWSRRAQEYEAKINSGDLIAIAEVVRDLYRSDAQPEQSYSERQLFEAALDRMAREIAAVQKLTDTESLKLLDSQLQKGPRRGVKTDAADAEGEIEAVESPGEVEKAA